MKNYLHQWRWVLGHHWHFLIQIFHLDGPIAGVQVVMVDGEIIINPRKNKQSALFLNWQ